MLGKYDINLYSNKLISSLFNYFIWHRHYGFLIKDGADSDTNTGGVFVYIKWQRYGVTNCMCVYLLI